MVDRPPGHFKNTVKWIFQLNFKQQLNHKLFMAQENLEVPNILEKISLKRALIVTNGVDVGYPGRLQNLFRIPACLSNF